MGHSKKLAMGTPLPGNPAGLGATSNMLNCPASESPTTMATQSKELGIFWLGPFEMDLAAGWLYEQGILG